MVLSVSSTKKNHGSCGSPYIQRMKKFGGRLKDLRTKLGMSQQQIADAVGVTQKAISLLENDPERIPQADTLSKLAAYFQVDPGWFLTGKGQQSPVSSLVPEESELILLYRALSPAGRDFILGRTREMYRSEYEHQTTERTKAEPPARSTTRGEH